MTLTEFLLARITEDEAVARDAGDGGPVMNGRRSELELGWDRDYGKVDGVVEIDAGRVLVEAAAKRAIVTAMREVAEDDGEYSGWVALAETPLRLLAAVYSDHPDYRPEWFINIYAPGE